LCRGIQYSKTNTIVVPLATAFHAFPTPPPAPPLCTSGVVKQLLAVAVPVMMIPGPAGCAGVIGAGAIATTLVLPGVHMVNARLVGLLPMSCAALVVTETLVAKGNPTVGCAFGGLAIKSAAPSARIATQAE
jgi:hypothetical protein